MRLNVIKIAMNPEVKTWFSSLVPISTPTELSDIFVLQYYVNSIASRDKLVQ